MLLEGKEMLTWPLGGGHTGWRYCPRECPHVCVVGCRAGILVFSEETRANSESGVSCPSLPREVLPEGYRLDFPVWGQNCRRKKTNRALFMSTGTCVPYPSVDRHAHPVSAPAILHGREASNGQAQLWGNQGMEGTDTQTQDAGVPRGRWPRVEKGGGAARPGGTDCQGRSGPEVTDHAGGAWALVAVGAAQVGRLQEGQGKGSRGGTWGSKEGSTGGQSLWVAWHMC